MNTAPRRSLAASTVFVLALTGSLASTTPAFAVDSQRPTLTIDAPSNAFVRTGDPVTVSGADDMELTRLSANIHGSTGFLANVGTSVVSGAAATATWAFPALPDGQYELRAGARDASDNVETSSRTVIVDTLAPTATLQSPAPGLVVAPGTVLPISGTIVDANPSITYLALGSTGLQYDSSGLSALSSSIDTTGFATGSYTIRLEARDAAGNKGAASVATVTFTVDASAPDVVITSPADGSFVRPGTTLPFTATIADSNPWIYYATVDGVGIDYAQGSSLTNYATTVDTTDWVDGSVHRLGFEARDRFGQKDAGSSAVVRITADASRPVVAFTAPAVGTAVAGTVLVSGTATDVGSGVADTATLAIRPINVNGNCGAFAQTWQVPVVDGMWSASVDTSVFSDGDYCFTVLASDRVGNTNGGGNHLKSFSIDNTAPAVPATLAPGGFTLTADEFRWSAVTDPNGVTYEVVVGSHPNTSAGRLNDGVTIGSGIAGTTLAYAIPTGPLQWQVRAVDALGNASAWSAPRGAQIIGIPEISAPVDGLVFAEESLTASWSAVFGIGGVDRYEIEYGLDRNDDGVLEYEYRSVAGSAWSPGAMVSRTQTFTTGYEGQLTMRVRAIYEIPFSPSSPSSVRGPWSETVSYLRDTGRPTITIAAPNNDAVFDGSAPIDVVVEAADGAAINRIVANLYDADNAVFLRAIGSTSASQPIAVRSASRTWSIPAGLADGTYTVRASASDLAGATSVTTATFTIDRTLEIELPVIDLPDPEQPESETPDPGLPQGAPPAVDDGAAPNSGGGPATQSSASSVQTFSSSDDGEATGVEPDNSAPAGEETADEQVDLTTLSSNGDEASASESDSASRSQAPAGIDAAWWWLLILLGVIVATIVAFMARSRRTA